MRNSKDVRLSCQILHIFLKPNTTLIIWLYNYFFFFYKFRVDRDYFSMHGFITYRLIVGWNVKVIITVLQFSPGAFDIFQVDIVVGTPGRLDDLVSTGKLNLSQVRFLVLDEAVC